MRLLMPGYYDDLTLQKEMIPEWQRIERYEYCSMDTDVKKTSFMDKISGLFRRK